MNKPAITLVIAMIMAVFGFQISGIVNATSQNSSTIMDKQKIIVTWLEKNDTKTSDSPVISVSEKDFWIVILPL
jgi:hypothetical protein